MTTFLNDAFAMLLAVSLGAGVLGLAALLLTPAMRGVGARSRYLLWMLLFVALLVPLRPSLGVSLFHIGLPSAATKEPLAENDSLSAAAANSTVANGAVNVGQTPSEGSAFSTASAVAEAGVKSALIPSSSMLAQAQAWIGSVLDDALQQTIRWLSTLWLAGVLILGGYQLWRHARFVRTVRRWSEPASDPEVTALYESIVQEMGMARSPAIALCAGVRSPLLYGFFAPTILLPTHTIPHDELALILRHELIHYQRGDLWWRALILLATALHWFNPAVYLMAQAADAECEISCDERLLRGMDGRERRRYGEAILGVVGQGGIPHSALTTTFYGGKQGMKTRMEAIMDTSTKRTGVAVLLVMALALLSTSALFAAEPAPVTPVAPPGAAETASAQSMILRMVDGELQVSSDGGKNWEVATDLDLRGAPAIYFSPAISGVVRSADSVSIQMLPASAAGSATGATALQAGMAVSTTAIPLPVLGGAVPVLPTFSVESTSPSASGSVAVMAVPAPVSGTLAQGSTTAVPMPVVAGEPLVIVTSAIVRDEEADAEAVAEADAASMAGDADFVAAAPVVVVMRDEEADPAHAIVVDAAPAAPLLSIVREGMEPGFAVPAMPPLAIVVESASALPASPPLAIVAGSTAATATTSAAVFAPAEVAPIDLTFADYEAVGIVADDTGALTFGGLPVLLLIDVTPQGSLSIASGATEGLSLQIVRDGEGDIIGVQVVE